MNLKYEKGTRLLIELCGGQIFEGTYVYNNNTQISITDVSEYPSKVKLKSVLNFYTMEIEAITNLDSKHKKESETEEEKVETKLINLDRVKEIANKYKYIGQVDSRFKAAIDYLNTQPLISVLGFGCWIGRHTTINLMGIGTLDEVFLIDIMSSPDRAFDLGLQAILESDRIKKIVSDSKSLTDCLHYNYKVSLKNIFDVQVVDYLITQKETNIFPKKMRTLEESICFYFGIPACVMKEKISQKQLLERPVSERTQSNAALQVGYLFELHKVLINKLLLNVDKVTECFATCMIHESNVNSLSLGGTNVPEKVKNLNITL